MSGRWQVGVLIVVCVVACAVTTRAAEDTFALVESGRSGYSIYFGSDAPPSVRRAAEEIQRVIRISTGVELPVINEPAEPMICLGDNAAARAAGVTTAELPDEGFRIVTRGRNLFIAGRDTPGDKPQWRGWTSRGTLFGACEFLERVVGVRWLMPEEFGEDIPRHETLRAPVMNLRDAPDFAVRNLAYVQERRPPADKRPSAPAIWLLRNRIPPSSEGQRIGAGHAWDDYVKPEVWEAHPEYLAVSAATKKQRSFKNPKHVKFCTSNDGLVEEFVRGVIAWLEKNSNLREASISPSDGGDFCECDKCLSKTTKDPYGKRSYTSVILDFYNRVGKKVAQKLPDRQVGGLVYYNYMYPPVSPIEMEPNVVLVWAPLNYYGWGLAKPVYKQEFERVLAGWLAVTRNFVYHNYSTWMRSYNGAPVPPGLDLLKLEIPALKRHGVWGVDMVGQGAWGYGAVGNYILARQMWRADIDVDEVYREWLQRSYGPGWQAMDRLYMMLESRMLERKRKETIEYHGEMYEVNYDVIEKVYLPVFTEMERLYLEALGQASTDGQRKRLEAFGENLIMLHYNMRQAGMPLSKPENSFFYRSDEAYRKFLDDTEFSLALCRDHGKRFTGPIWKKQWQGD